MRAVGEKTERAPEVRRTGDGVSWLGETEGRRGGHTDCAAAADAEETEAGEGDGEGGDVGGDVADDHYRRGVAGDELGRHGVGVDG